jgi:hypothetical protein
MMRTTRTNAPRKIHFKVVRSPFQSTPPDYSASADDAAESGPFRATAITSRPTDLPSIGMPGGDEEEL